MSAAFNRASSASARRSATFPPGTCRDLQLTGSSLTDHLTLTRVEFRLSG